MLRQVVIVLFCAMGAWPCKAQFVSRTAQPFQLASTYNPAFSGIEGYGDLKLAYRYQWTGYTDAPSYIYATFNGRLKRPTVWNDQSLRLSSAAQQQMGAMPKGKGVMMGWSAQVLSETAGPTTRAGGQLSYAFHYPIAKKTHFAIGVSAQVDNTKIDLSKIELGQAGDPFYDFLASKGSSYTNLNIRAGIVVYGERFYVGASYLPLFNQIIQESGLDEENEFYTGSLMAGLAIGNSSEVAVKPSVFALLDQSSQLAIDYSAKMYIRNKVWWGITYRDVKSIVILAGVQLNAAVGFGYSYEQSLGGFNTYNGGSHDLVLNVRFGNFKKLTPYLW